MSLLVIVLVVLLLCGGGGYYGYGRWGMNGGMGGGLGLLLLLILLYILFGGRLAHGQPPVSSLPVRSYYVTDPATFPSVPAPAHMLVFLNGLFQTPGIDYDLAHGAIAFRSHPDGASFLPPGAGLSVVTLP